MKRISSLLFFLCLTLLHGQDPQASSGFVRFMNLVDAGEGNTKLEINGKDIWEPGYRLGQKTGALPYSGGTQKFVVTKEGCLTAEREVKVVKGKSQTIVAFAEEVFDEEGESLGWQIKLASLQQHTPEQGLVVTFVSFCKDDVLDLTIEERQTDKTFKQSVRKRRSERLKLVDSGRVRATVSCGGEVIGSIKVEDQGNYIAMIFDSDEGKRKLITFYDPQFMISGS
ncbi:hypothetical protein [Roseibacillus persicicus]|uniref:Uncharacterized protein n=1 Tax=Roseibacillus persicicus TaxID=454148 RepID=A0A918TIS3_9BACT|nr:hypothetical protein [Roseibacillus persicicus]MDQ8192039.1 hypothetical protein [Roseibacillus persicicus]GHC49523.1 hypothetical protein GCM10007100_14350 [Roseibacillus persicicus]